MTASVKLLRAAACAHQGGADEEDLGIATLVSALRSDLDVDGSSRRGTLQGLIDALTGRDDADHSAAAHVLNCISWEAFRIVLSIVESPHGKLRGADDATSGVEVVEVDNDVAGGSLSPVGEVEGLALRLLQVMAEVVSPKELHLIALENLQGSYHPKSLQAILTLLRRSTELMAPQQRTKFLEAGMRPALGTLKRMFTAWAGRDPLTRIAAADKDGDYPGDAEGLSSDEDEDDEFSTTITNDTISGGDAYAKPSITTTKAAAKTAEAAVEFIGPLLQQAGEERERAYRRDGALWCSGLSWKMNNGVTSGQTPQMAVPVAVATAGADDPPPRPPATVDTTEARESADRSLASFLAFALSALAVISPKSSVVVYDSSDESKDTAACAAAAPCSSSSDCDETVALARAEGRLVELIVNGATAVDLQLVLLHRYRASYAKRMRGGRLGKEKGKEVNPSPRPPGVPLKRCFFDQSRLGELLASSDGVQDVSLGVSALAHLVACSPELRDKLLPMVWSRQTERRLFLPHAQDLMRMKSKIIAGKGLELACFIAERLGSWPDETGAFAFAWAPENESGGEWGSDNFAGGAKDGDRRAVSDETRTERSQERTHAFDPYRFDLTGFLQVLIDVVVTCPLASLRSRGHAAMESFLAGADPHSRFRVLQRLVDRCPWPNATGLLLDAFRREIDRGLRPRYQQPPGAAVAADSASTIPSVSSSSSTIVATSAGEGGRGAPADGGFTSPFASAQAGDFVCEQLRRACRLVIGGLQSSSLLVDMDSRTGAFALARYALVMDRSVAGGRLKLREPERLGSTRVLVQVFLDEMRKTTCGARNAVPGLFRLFILEDAAQRCLQELVLILPSV